MGDRRGKRRQVVASQTGLFGTNIHLGQTQKEETGIYPSNTFVPTIFRHTLIFAASRKLVPSVLKQCSSGKAKYIEKSLHSLSFAGQIPVSSFRCVSAKLNILYYIETEYFVAY